MKHRRSYLKYVLIIFLIKMVVSRNVEYDGIPEKCFHGPHKEDYANFGLMMECAMNTKVRVLKRSFGGLNDELIDDLNDRQWRMAQIEIAKQALDSRVFQII